MTVLSSFRIYCLDIIKMAKLLTREMSHAPVNNCFLRIRLFSSKMITSGPDKDMFYTFYFAIDSYFGQSNEKNKLIMLNQAVGER